MTRLPLHKYLFSSSLAKEKAVQKQDPEKIRKTRKSKILRAKKMCPQTRGGLLMILLLMYGWSISPVGTNVQKAETLPLRVDCLAQARCRDLDVNGPAGHRTTEPTEAKLCCYAKYYRLLVGRRARNGSWYTSRVVRDSLL